jgi:PAS domain S-box-containing protein
MRSDIEPGEAASARRERDVLAAALQRVSDGFVAFDRDWRYTYVNARAAMLLRRQPEELLGKSLWELFPQTRGQPFEAAADRALATQEMTFVQVHFALTRSWFECRIYPSSNGLSVFFHDITQRKRAQDLVLGQSAVLEQIAHGASLTTSLTTLLRLVEENSPDSRASILLLDPDGQRLRHGAAPSLPASYTDPIDGAAIGPHAGSCGTAAFTREAVIVEDIATDPRWAAYRDHALSHGLRACWSTPIFDEKGELLGTFAIYANEPQLPRESAKRVVEMATHLAAIAITRERAESARKEQERIREKNRELEESNRAVQAASRLKSEFLATMSHELRTPLNAILGFSEYLIDQHAGPLAPRQLECMQHVLVSGRHLLQLVSDVLDLAKVEAGKLELFPVEFMLDDVLQEVASVVGGLARDKRIALGVRCDPALGRVTLDRQKFKQILFNLFANAVKFTGEGGAVDVTARALDRDRLEIRVHDNGIGIASEDLPKLFRAFQQLDSSASRHHEGTGLGLALTKRFVESQQGRIGVESELGVGSTFYVVLPRTLLISGV